MRRTRFSRTGFTGALLTTVLLSWLPAQAERPGLRIAGAELIEQVAGAELIEQVTVFVNPSGGGSAATWRQAEPLRHQVREPQAMGVMTRAGASILGRDDFHAAAGA